MVVLRTMVAELVTMAEAARLLGVTVRRIDQLQREGQLPKLKNNLTRANLIPRASVVELKQARSEYVVVGMVS